MTEMITGSGLRYNDIRDGSGETATGRAQTAYGAQGPGGIIPPGTALVFEIELLEISS